MSIIARYRNAINAIEDALKEQELFDQHSTEIFEILNELHNQLSNYKRPWAVSMLNRIDTILWEYTPHTSINSSVMRAKGGKMTAPANDYSLDIFLGAAAVGFIALKIIGFFCVSPPS